VKNFKLRQRRERCGEEAGVAAENGTLRGRRRRCGKIDLCCGRQIHVAALRASITSRLNAQADLQYVINPNTDPQMANALVSLIRVEIGFP
jgi:hypothetical protein